MQSKLCLSETNRKIGGVCGGVGEYFNIDPTLVRLVWLFLILFFGTGLVAYFVAWILIPRAPKF